ncbi:hypothetical protein [Novosphingobium sp. SG720]|uniref:hypothetical protein n=1 Tax=Novosphingobium sp. SG720 TaxID=2586998 RepID=UPI0014469D9A|nr:hypothetical protein [Novosphingobium sp. SG720]NKJ42692.1 heme/copper-type cytochrome/quinol oxidase subunit 4 [Novosphingobium sp. SG720]
MAIARNFTIITLSALASSTLLAAIAIGIHGSVTLGLFLGVLPGVALLVAPTVALWLLAFLAVFLPSVGLMRFFAEDKTVSIRAFIFTLMVSIAVAVTGLWLLPQSSRSSANERIAPYLSNNIQPSAKIALGGNVMLETENFDWIYGGSQVVSNALECNADCLWLLSDDRIKSVTINTTGRQPALSLKDTQNISRPLNPGARTYRLNKNGKCSGNVVPIAFTSGRPSIMRTSEQFDAWMANFPKNSCLEQFDPLSDYDFMLRSGRWLDGNETDPWSLSDNEVQGTYNEIRNHDGSLLMGEYRPTTPGLAAPLAIYPVSGGAEAKFGWARTTFPIDRDEDWDIAGHQVGALFAWIAPPQS